jgi:hypothetical protein
MRSLGYLLAFVAVAGGAADVIALTKGTPVRIRASGLGGNWLDGRIGASPAGCTMVLLNGKAPGGYTMVSLPGVAQMQLQQGSGWAEVAVKPLLAREPASCRSGDND